MGYPSFFSFIPDSLLTIILTPNTPMLCMFTMHCERSERCEQSGEWNEPRYRWQPDKTTEIEWVMFYSQTAI